jgi:hypothetical protein
MIDHSTVLDDQPYVPFSNWCLRQAFSSMNRNNNGVVRTTVYHIAIAPSHLTDPDNECAPEISNPSGWAAGSRAT